MRPGNQVAVASSLAWMLTVPQAFEVSWTELELRAGRQPLPAGPTVVEAGWQAGQPARRAGRTPRRAGGSSPPTRTPAGSSGARADRPTLGAQARRWRIMTRS